MEFGPLSWRRCSCYQVWNFSHKKIIIPVSVHLHFPTKTHAVCLQALQTSGMHFQPHETLAIQFINAFFTSSCGLLLCWLSAACYSDLKHSNCWYAVLRSVSSREVYYVIPVHPCACAVGAWTTTNVVTCSSNHCSGIGAFKVVWAPPQTKLRHCNPPTPPSNIM